MDRGKESCPYVHFNSFAKGKVSVEERKGVHLESKGMDSSPTYTFKSCVTLAPKPAFPPGKWEWEFPTVLWESIKSIFESALYTKYSIKCHAWV